MSILRFKKYRRLLTAFLVGLYVELCIYEPGTLHGIGLGVMVMLLIADLVEMSGEE